MAIWRLIPTKSKNGCILYYFHKTKLLAEITYPPCPTVQCLRKCVWSPPPSPLLRITWHLSCTVLFPSDFITFIIIFSSCLFPVMKLTNTLQFYIVWSVGHTCVSHAHNKPIPQGEETLLVWIPVTF